MLRDKQLASLDFMNASADRAITLQGYTVDVEYYRNGEQQFDKYGEVIKPSDDDKVVVRTQVQPQFEDYLRVIDMVGFDREDPLPLEVVVKVSDTFIKVGTTIILENPVSGALNRWVVQEVTDSAIGRSFSRMVKCTPERSGDVHREFSGARNYDGNTKYT